MATTVGKYHLFERNRRGRTCFYYWYENRGTRIQKACGHGCDNKRSAVAFLEQLLVGHRSVAMTDHYDRPILIERLAAYQGVRPSVEPPFLSRKLRKNPDFLYSVCR
jgi:hypothetical protein